MRKIILAVLLLFLFSINAFAESLETVPTETTVQGDVYGENDNNQPEPASKNIGGDITGTNTWAGSINLTADVVVMDTLYISDTIVTGNDFEIINMGRIIVTGNAVLKNTFISSSGGSMSYEGGSLSLIATDTKGPLITSVNPVNNAVGTSVSKDITIAFNEDVLSGVAYDKITLIDPNNNPVNFTTDISGAEIIINPSQDLNINTRYTVTIPSRAVKDNANNFYDQSYSFSFTTQSSTDSIYPTVTSANPVNGSTNIPIKNEITIYFSEEVQEGTAYSGIALKNSSGQTIAASKKLNDKNLVISPSEDLSANTRYTISIPAGAIRDKANNNLRSMYSLSFTTQRSLDNIAPTVTSVNPVNGSTKILVDKEIIINFSENVQQGTAYSAIALRNSSGEIIAADIQLDNDLLKIKPTENLSENTKYTITIPASSVKDTANNVFQKNYSFSFTTLGNESLFTDVTPGFWAKDDIELMASKGIVTGKTAARFAPNDKITRAEFATLLVRALGLPPYQGEIGQFTDITNSDWYYETVEAAARAGIINGYGNRKFGAGNYITREEMAVMIVRAMNVKGVSVDLIPSQTEQLLQAFYDRSKIHAWANVGVAKGVHFGIINGVNANTFAPEKNATRAEAVTMIKRMLEKTKLL